MELLYSMRRKPLKCEPPHYESVSDPEMVRPICTISSCNVIAFSSPTELSDTSGDTWGGHVFVCDLDTPWDSHRVTSTSYPVSTLEWDGEGRQLLVGTTVGDVSVFGMKDFLLNEWTCLYSANFAGEHIVAGVFFHMGRRVVSADKKTDTPVTERLQVLRATPTLKGFGGAACEGACVVTATGLVCALSPPAPAPAPAPGGGGAGGGGDAGRALAATDTLRAHRDHVTHASFAHKNGSLLVAAVQAGPRACVRCALCGVSRAGGALAPAGGAATQRLPALALQPLPTVYLLDGTRPTCITWCLREDTDTLLVAGTTLTMWKLTERAYPVHKLLAKGAVQGGTTPGGGLKPPTDCFNTVADNTIRLGWGSIWEAALCLPVAKTTVPEDEKSSTSLQPSTLLFKQIQVWQQTGSWPAEGVHVASCRSPAAAPHVVLACPRRVCLLSRDNHHYICSRAVVTGGGPGAGGGPAETAQGSAAPPKKTKYGAGGPLGGGGCAVLSCCDISTLGGVAVAVDSHAQLHVYRLAQPWHDIPTPLSVQLSCNALEYALVTGYDCLDLLLTLKANVVDAVYDRLTESFQRQAPSFQQYYYQGWLKMRIALCRVSGVGARSSSALTCLQTLWAAGAAAGAALRPDDRPETAPLAALLDDLHADHDKALLSLEAKSEVWGEGAALVPLRRVLQRVVDVAATVAASLPAATPGHHHGYELYTDPAAITLLRKVLLVARAGGAGDGTLSRLLARYQQAAAPRQDLMEECAVVGSQTSSPRVWEALPRCCVSSPHCRQLPLHLEYGVEPETLRSAPDPPASFAQYDTAPTTTMDSIRYMYLGGGSAPARWRQCARCGSRALPHAQPARHPLQRAYDARFLPACRCGGKWTLFSNI